MSRWKVAAAAVGVAITRTGWLWWRTAAGTGDERDRADREAAIEQLKEQYLRDTRGGAADSGTVHFYPEDQVGPLTDE